MEFGIAMGLAVSLLLADAAKSDTAPNGNTFQGVWQLSSGQADGKVLSLAQLKGGKLVIEGDRYTVTLANLGTVTGTQKLGKRARTPDNRHHGRQWFPPRPDLSGHLRTQRQRVPRGLCSTRGASAVEIRNRAGEWPMDARLEAYEGIAGRTAHRLLS